MIATVILISVAIGIGIAVAFWAGALTGHYSKYGKLELAITTHYATGVTGGWKITIAGSNQGSQDLTVIQVDLNGVPYNSFNGVSINTSLPLSIPAGKSFGMVLNIPSNIFSSGQSIQVTVMTAEGQDYPMTVTLP